MFPKQACDVAARSLFFLSPSEPSMNVEDYLKRMQCEFDDYKNIEPNLDTLTKLIVTHLYAIPFENLGKASMKEPRILTMSPPSLCHRLSAFPRPFSMRTFLLQPSHQYPV